MTHLSFNNNIILAKGNKVKIIFLFHKKSKKQLKLRRFNLKY